MFGNLDVKKTGIEEVAGHKCEIFEGRIILPPPPSQQNSAAKQPEITIKVWVEPETQSVHVLVSVRRNPQHLPMEQIVLQHQQ